MYKLSTSQFDIKTYNSALMHHCIVIEFDILSSSCLINSITIDPFYPQELTLLLNNIVSDVKLYGIEKVIQQVEEFDWDSNISKISEFVFVNKNTDYNFINIMCTIDDFPIGVMKSLGFIPFDNI